MKRFFLCSILVFSVAVMFAQSFDATTKWPYVYKDFIDGAVYINGAKKDLKMNVHLVNSALHYLNGDQIVQFDTKNASDTVFAVIGVDKYIKTKNGFARIVGNEGSVYVLAVKLADLDQLSSSTGAYGISSQVSAKNNLSSFELGGISNLNHRQLILEKEDGKILTLKTDYYLLINGELVSAKRKEVENSLKSDEEKSKFNQFLKENKVKWSDEKSLLKLLAFFH